LGPQLLVDATHDRASPPGCGRLRRLSPRHSHVPASQVHCPRIRPQRLTPRSCESVAPRPAMPPAPLRPAYWQLICLRIHPTRRVSHNVVGTLTFLLCSHSQRAMIGQVGIGVGGELRNQGRIGRGRYITIGDAQPVQWLRPTPWRGGQLPGGTDPRAYCLRGCFV